MIDISQEIIDQNLRLKRFFLGVSAHLMNTCFVLLCVYFGYLQFNIAFIYIFLVLLLNISIFLIIKSGFNLRFKDPSLTFIQLIIPPLFALYLMYFAGHARSAFVILGISMFAFGIFQFKMRDFVFLGVYILLGYAALIFLLYSQHSQIFDLRLEITVWVATCIALFQFGFLADTISKLKLKLKLKLSESAAQNIELNNALIKINEMATHDELTGVYNRRFLIEKITSEASRCARNNSSFSLCMVDIDLFKNVNDTYGHPIGDEVLRRVANAAASSLRDIDIFGRIGGEEFLMILADTNENGAMITAERIRQEIAKINLSDINDQLKVTASLGVAEHHKGCDPIDTLKLADTALYSAKNNGRNQISNLHKKEDKNI